MFYKTKANSMNDTKLECSFQFVKKLSNTVIKCSFQFVKKLSNTVNSWFFLSYITPYFMPRYYVREFYMENILEKKLFCNLLRGFGKNASTTKKTTTKRAVVTK